MDSSFEVVDLKSGNVIGGYESEEEALSSLRRSLQTHGPRAIRNLSLIHISDDDQIVVAMQKGLERLVRDSEIRPKVVSGLHCTPERLAYWYFRLNGFMTIENFLVHHETRSDPRTDVDILATRFAHRCENKVRPMTDDPRVAECETFANVIIAEVKKGPCRLNGPWTNSDAENMERVLRSVGCATEDEVSLAAASLYGMGRWSNDTATIRLFAVGERINDELVIGREQQIEWTSVIEFCVERFRNYRPQKASNTQWSADGIRLRQLALSMDVEGIRHSFNLD